MTEADIAPEAVGKPTASALILPLAELAHSMYRAFMDAHQMAVGFGFTPAFAALPKWKRDGVCDGVRALLDNPHWGPAETHQNWVIYMQGQGFQIGEVFSEEAKTHPALIPFDMLPKGERIKDFLFCYAVRAAIVFYHQTRSKEFAEYVARLETAGGTPPNPARKK